MHATEPDITDSATPQSDNDQQQVAEPGASDSLTPQPVVSEAQQELPEQYLLEQEPLEQPERDFTYQYVLPEVSGLQQGNPAMVALGVGFNRIKAGRATGAYLSGMAPVSDTPLGVYGRAEIIRDKYKTGYFWSWNMAVGIGWYHFMAFTPFVSVGKCFSNYSTCYFNTRHPTANDDDIDAFYFGAGTYIKSPFKIGVFEIAFDWSPYKHYRGRAFYVGYGLTF